MTIGRCHVCTQLRPLTKEHVPPEACGNTGPQTAVTFDGLLRGLRKGHQFQNGVYKQSLCKSCNSFTGHQYVPALAEMYRQAIIYYEIKKVPLGVLLPWTLRPLAVAKQVVTMWLALEGGNRESATLDEARRFVLQPLRTTGRPPWRLYVYLHTGVPCAHGGAGAIIVEPRAIVLFRAQVGLWPLGFIVLPNDASHMEYADAMAYTDITHFCSAPPLLISQQFIHLRPDQSALEKLQKQQ